jgi:hypothetical protein
MAKVFSGSIAVNHEGGGAVYFKILRYGPVFGG